MDTFKDKWEFYYSTIYPKIAKLLVSLKLFETQLLADIWFNSTGESWRGAYINGIKDPSLPNENKIQWSVFGIKFNKPAIYVDIWHFLKSLLILTLCILVAINLPIYFIIVNKLVTRIIYVIALDFIWGIIFQIFYNKK